MQSKSDIALAVVVAIVDLGIGWKARQNAIQSLVHLLCRTFEEPTASSNKSACTVSPENFCRAGTATYKVSLESTNRSADVLK